MIRLEGQLTEELDDVTVKFLKKGGKINSLYEASLNFKIIKNNTRINGTIEDLIRLCEFYEKAVKI